MNCKIDGCDCEAMYKEQGVCQKHYFRYMRNGDYAVHRKAKDKILHSGGYVLLHKKGHPLTDKSNYVYEHRFVYYTEISKEVSNCAMCNKGVDWNSVHIDHIDENRANNHHSNLRALCNGCNVSRSRDTSKDGVMITYANETKNAEAWGRDKRISVKGHCIRQRKKRGMTDYEALFGEKKTHKGTSCLR